MGRAGGVGGRPGLVAALRGQVATAWSKTPHQDLIDRVQANVLRSLVPAHPNGFTPLFAAKPLTRCRKDMMAASLEEKLLQLKSLEDRGLIDKASADAERTQLLRDGLGTSAAPQADRTAPTEAGSDGNTVEADVYAVKNGPKFFVFSRRDVVTVVHPPKVGWLRSWVTPPEQVLFGVPLSAGGDLKRARREWLPGIVRAAFGGRPHLKPLRAVGAKGGLMMTGLMATRRVSIRYGRADAIAFAYVQSAQPDPTDSWAIPEKWGITQPWVVRLIRHGGVNHTAYHDEFWGLVAGMARELGYRLDIRR